MTTPGSSDVKVNKHALDIGRYFAYDATTLILQFSLSSLLFGVLTVLSFTTVSLLLRRRESRDTSIRTPLLSTIILYASTSVYMAGLIWNWASMTRIVSEVNEGIILSDGYDGRASLVAFEKAVLKQSWMVTIALGINIIVGDAVVWWRACVIWQSRAIYCTGPILLVLTLIFGIIGAQQSDTGPLIDIYLMYGGSGFTDAAAAMSLVTNLTATLLIAFKACFHRRRLKKYLGDTSGTKTRVLKVLALFIESGSVYCTILAAVLIYEFTYKSSSALVDAGYYFIYGCLVPIVAIYPTVIIVITAVNCSPLEWGLSPLSDLGQAAPHRGEHIATPSIIGFRPSTFCSTALEDGRDTRMCDSL